MLQFHYPFEIGFCHILPHQSFILPFIASLVQQPQIIWEAIWCFHQILMFFRRIVYCFCILYNKNNISHIIWGTVWTVHFVFLNLVRWSIACDRKRLWSRVIETFFFQRLLKKLKFPSEGGTGHLVREIRLYWREKAFVLFVIGWGRSVTEQCLT